MPEYINKPSYPNTAGVFGYTLDGNLVINRGYVNKNKWRTQVTSPSIPSFTLPSSPSTTILGYGLDSYGSSDYGSPDPPV